MKKFILSLLMLLSLTVSAQYTDGFFRYNNDVYENRDDIFDFNTTIPADGITIYGFGEPVPLDGGLLILTVAGAGYTALRRKSYKSYKTHRTHKSYNSSTTLFAALTLLLLMPSCKKKVETVDTTPQAPTNGVLITLNVGDGSKVTVDPHGDPYATISFDTYDYIYVGNNGKYCGFLCYIDEGNFVGHITPESENDYLHFYFMSDFGFWLLPEPTSLDISDQHEKYPVIAYAHSTIKYDQNITEYTAKLQLYCALVEFDVSVTEDPYNTGMPADVIINGMNNVVDVHFDANNAATGTTGEPYTFSKNGDGNITLHKEANNERWAILLPQEAVSGVQATAIGFEPASATFDVPAITAGGFYNHNNSNINVTFPSTIPIGAIPSLFTVNSDGDKVFFSQGNLQYQATTSTWRFAENQYDLIGEGNANISPTYDGWIDLFGWGTKDNPTESDIDYDYRWHEWGNNAISNGSNTPNSGWHTLSPEQWDYLLNGRNTAYRYTMAYLYLGGTHFVKGMILFPDNFSGEKPDGVGFGHPNTPNDYDGYCGTPEAWAALENMGCVFLPAAGRRAGIDVHYYSGGGPEPSLFYWSNTSSSNQAKYMEAWRNEVAIKDFYRHVGMSVRLVRTYNEN